MSAINKHLSTPNENHDSKFKEIKSIINKPIEEEKSKLISKKNDIDLNLEEKNRDLALYDTQEFEFLEELETKFASFSILDGRPQESYNKSYNYLVRIQDSWIGEAGRYLDGYPKVNHEDGKYNVVALIRKETLKVGRFGIKISIEASKRDIHKDKIVQLSNEILTLQQESIRIQEAINQLRTPLD